MKGDFSRLRFNPAAHYTAVLEQQGRVGLDADANEQRAIDQHVRETEITDVIGPFGGPSNDLGFGISVVGNSIAIGAGRYYAHGLLCDSLSQLAYMQQPYLLDPPSSDAQLLAGLQSGASTAVKVYLEVWQRLVTALDDPCLLEAALGGADTTARLQTVWRVVAEAIAATARPTGATIAGISVSLLNTAGFATAAPSATAGAATTAGGATTTLSCCDSMYQPILTVRSGTMNAQTTGASSECSCEPTPAAGYRGIENQLYRVEIHQPGALGAATFKWSRENGSVVAAIATISANQVTVNSLGRDASLGFAPGQWVEITDDRSQFGFPANHPGQLYQIQSVTPAQLAVTLTQPVSGIDLGRKPRMRRWDQSASPAGPNGIPLSGSWLDLENGIQVQFGAGFFRSGDYWLIPARTAKGAIEWPPCGATGGAFQPPHEIEIFRAPLACIQWTANQVFTIEDCRHKFPPLTEVVPGAAAALHVVKTNWNNDDILAFDQMLSAGLTLSLDQAPASRVDSSIFTLTLEVPVISQSETAAVAQGLPPIVLRVDNVLDGQITVKGNDVTWNLPVRDVAGGIPQIGALALLDAMLLQGVSYGAFARARVRVYGHNVSAGSGASQVFLDGQTFGAPGIRSDKVTPCTALTFPSGSGAKASDFQSWFFLVPTLTVTTLSVLPQNVVFTPTLPNPPSPVATLTLNYAPMADTVLSLSVITPANVPASVAVPGTVTVPRGKASTTFPVTVHNTSMTTAQTFQIVASLKNALGLTSSATANLAVTGMVTLF